MEKSAVKVWTKYFFMYGMVVLAFGQRRRPNIILLITDDQDVMLNSMDVMEQTKHFISQQGVEFTNAFTTTPMCCPSRSSILTGLYAHNHHVYTNNDNCSSVLWQRSHETKSYATYLNKSGYHTGYFGKYLNEYNGSYTPPGWDYWMGLVKNSKYYNYTLLHNGAKEMHGNDYAKDYFTDLVTNRSIQFFQDSKKEDKERPVLTVVSFPAPHGPEDSAPQYQDYYPDPVSHITKSFDYTPNPDKHWIIRQRSTGMDETQLRFSKLLQQRRLQTLKSVDDNIKKVGGKLPMTLICGNNEPQLTSNFSIFDMLQEAGELENTYVIYSSDHGYHIGQFALAKGKSMPYDFDIRIPFLIRGPNLPKWEISKKIALNIDIAPTILDIAGVKVPSEMDGRSLLDVFKIKNGKTENVEPWRDSFLVERLKRHWNRTHFSKPKMAKETKLEKLEKLCRSENYADPCNIGQDWTCVTDSDGKLRLQKCKKEKKPQKHKKRPNNQQRRRKKLCPCPKNHRLSDGLDSDTDEVNVLQTCKKGASSSGHRRNRGGRERERGKRYRKNVQYVHDKVYNSYNELRKSRSQNRGRYKRDTEPDFKSSTKNNTNKMDKSNSMVLTSKCRLYMPNFEIRCHENLYNDPREWVKHMGHLARSVKTLQIRMKYMKTLKSCLSAYNQMTKSVQMCECPLPPPKPKQPKIKSENDKSSDNSTHPLTDLVAQANKDFTEQQREYYERRETVQLMKEMRRAKLERIAEREKQGKFRLKKCGKEGVTCFKLTKSTWATEPKWDGDDQCYCTNCNNNTYWCIRIINEDTNMMYCQFITGFIEYFEMNGDPAQLVNREMDLDKDEHDVFLDMIEKYKGCSGADDCTLDPFNNKVVAKAPDDDLDTDIGILQGRSFAPAYNQTMVDDPVAQLPSIDSYSDELDVDLDENDNLGSLPSQRREPGNNQQQSAKQVIKGHRQRKKQNAPKTKKTSSTQKKSVKNSQKKDETQRSNKKKRQKATKLQEPNGLSPKEEIQQKVQDRPRRIRYSSQQKNRRSKTKRKHTSLQ